MSTGGKWLLGLGAGLGLLALLGRGRAAASRRPLSEAERRRLAGLVVPARKALLRLQAALASRGIQTYIGQTGQSAETAAEMFASGRSATRRSWHRVGRAVDLYIIDPRDGRIDTSALREDLYATMGAIARATGWRWLGLGTLTNAETGATFTDPQHLEWRDGLTWDQAAREVGLSGLSTRALLIATLIPGIPPLP